MTPTEYEKAVVERFRTYWPPPRYVVRHNIRLLGQKAKASRQIDISVFEAGQSAPFLIAEAKRHGRPVDAVKAGSTIALAQDVGGLPANDAPAENPRNAVRPAQAHGTHEPSD